MYYRSCSIDVDVSYISDGTAYGSLDVALDFLGCRDHDDEDASQAGTPSRAALSMFATSQMKNKIHGAKMEAVKKNRFMLHPTVRWITMDHYSKCLNAW